MTWEEHIAKLKAEGRYEEVMAAREQRAEEHKKRSAALREAQAPLIADLQSAGFPVTTISDLVNTSVPYPKALPILLEHLQRPYPPIVRQFIARAMAVRPAKFAWNDLVRLFREEQDDQTKEGLAVALAAMADDGDLDEIIGLLECKKLGRKRVHLVQVLGRSKAPDAYEALVRLDADPQLRPEIQKFLRRAE